MMRVAYIFRPLVNTLISVFWCESAIEFIDMDADFINPRADYKQSLRPKNIDCDIKEEGGLFSTLSDKARCLGSDNGHNLWDTYMWRRGWPDASGINGELTATAMMNYQSLVPALVTVDADQ